MFLRRNKSLAAKLFTGTIMGLMMISTKGAFAGEVNNVDVKAKFDQSRSISSIDVDKEGNIYLSDKKESQILKLDQNGELVETFGSFGDGEGQFNDPRSVKVDKKGNIYVADSKNNRVQKLDSEGNVVKVYDEYFNGELRPSDLSVTEEGDMYIISNAHENMYSLYDGELEGQHEDIVRINEDGTYIKYWNENKNQNYIWPSPVKGQYAIPSGVEESNDGTVYITEDYGKWIYKTDVSGKYLGDINLEDIKGRPEKAVGKYGLSNFGYNNNNLDNNLTTDSEGNIYLVHTNDKLNKKVETIIKIDKDGNYIGEWSFDATQTNLGVHIKDMKAGEKGKLYILGETYNWDSDELKRDEIKNVVLTLDTNEDTETIQFTNDILGYEETSNKEVKAEEVVQEEIVEATEDVQETEEVATEEVKEENVETEVDVKVEEIKEEVEVTTEEVKKESQEDTQEPAVEEVTTQEEKKLVTKKLSSTDENIIYTGDWIEEWGSKYTNGGVAKVTLNAKSIKVLMRNQYNTGRVIVLVDGEMKVVQDTNQTEGMTSNVEAFYIEFDEVGEHTVELTPAQGEWIVFDGIEYETAEGQKTETQLTTEEEVQEPVAQELKAEEKEADSYSGNYVLDKFFDMY